MNDKHEKEACRCKRLKCKRHGDCVACRAHHADKKYPVACERAEKLMSMDDIAVGIRYNDDK